MGTPTVASVLPGYQAESWFALLAPAGTPADVIAKLNRALNKALAMPDLQKRLNTFGLVAVSSTPEQLRESIAAEVKRWGSGDPRIRYQGRMTCGFHAGSGTIEGCDDRRSGNACDGFARRRSGACSRIRSAVSSGRRPVVGAVERGADPAALRRICCASSPAKGHRGARC
ncbi:MAG: tripartite tricarboxylate transporter substrate-binding protein [Burkholderiaceae bacterium]|nr:tripartite tricarboxylate transporter substrate-binding protein [Burkholderiaceae bacterium]